MNGYQEKIDENSITYLTDFRKILQNICWIYLNISQVPVDSGQRVKKLKKSLKKAMFRPKPTAGYQGYQPYIKAFCTLDSMSSYPLQ